MKTTTLVRKSLVGVACLSFLIGSAAIAGEGKSEQKYTSRHPAQQVILVQVTGSRIPQRLVRYGQQVNSGSPLYVVQGDDLVRTGATTVAGILSLDPSITFARNGR